MENKTPAAPWPLPDPGVGRVTPAAGDDDAQQVGSTRKPAGVTRPTKPDEAATKSTPSLGGSYTLDDTTGACTLIERTQQPEGCTRYLAPQPKE